MTLPRTLTRRSVLVGLGSASALGLGANWALGARDRPSYTHYTYAMPSDGVETSQAGRITVAWYVTYNGTVQTTHGNGTVTDPDIVVDGDAAPLYVQDASGPLLTLENVLPGDRGTVLLGVEAETEPMAATFTPSLSATAENGRNEPEATAGDATTDGELQDALSTTVWRDVRCDGALDPAEGTFDVVRRGTLDDVTDALADGVGLGCIDPGETRCVGLKWRFDGGSLPDVNLAQTDGATFALELAAESCGGTA